MVSLEVAAEVVVPANVFSETIVHAAVSPEVAAHAAEPFEAAVLAAAPCVVMAPYNTLSVRHVTVEGTVDEHCTCSGNELFLVSDVTTAEPPKVSAVSTYELSSCPVAARRAVPERSSCPIMATEAVCESSSCSVTAMEAFYELPGCSVTTTEAALEPLHCSEMAEEPFLLGREEFGWTSQGMDWDWGQGIKSHHTQTCQGIWLQLSSEASYLG